MAVSVVMPALELAQETGKLVAWRTKEGERVAKGEPILDVETDKAVFEVEAPADGILAGVTARDGDVVPVGQTIAWIVGPGEAPPTDATPADLSGRKATQAATTTVTPAGGPDRPAAAGAKISPKARRLAKEHNVDISGMRGSGPGGEILASDILAAVESRNASAPPNVETLGTVGRLMAERTTQSWTTVPHFFVVREVDAGALIEAREQLSPALEQSSVRPTHTDLLVALVARALVKHPKMNASWTGEAIRLNPSVNIGVAMAVEDGVVVAVIANANTLSLGEIAVHRHDLAERARAGRLRPSDVTGATFTISNLGMFHVDAFSAIISPPQAAILAMGRIADRVVPLEGRPGIRPMITLTLSCDHRVVDGARAAVFLNDLAEAIRKPEEERSLL